MALRRAISMMNQVPVITSCAAKMMSSVPMSSCSCRRKCWAVSSSIVHHRGLHTVHQSWLITCPIRMYTTGIVNSKNLKKGFVSKIMEKVGIGRMKYSKSKLQMSALRLYLCTVELPEYDQIFQEMQLPDTYSSWHRISELHLWMCFVRLASEGKEGVFLRNNIMTYTWQDMEKRIKHLGEISATTRKEGINELSLQLKGALYAYDEGLLGDDRVLAGALWRTFFAKSCDDPEKLATMVHYVRKQILHLDTQESGVILSSGLLTFAPLHGKETDNSRTKHILNEIYNRV